MSAITHLIACVPASDLDASIDWYTRFAGRPPDMRAGDEMDSQAAAVRTRPVGSAVTLPYTELREFRAPRAC